MADNFKKWLEKLRKIIYVDGIKCIVCDDELSEDNNYCLCESCFKNLPFNSNNICLVCGTPIHDMGKICNTCANNARDFNLARSCLVYKDNIVNLIHNLKYNNGKYLAPYLSNILYDYFIKCPEFKDVDIIIPVPLSEKRVKFRGYNQSELLLVTFKEKGFDVDTKSLIRFRHTETQTDKSRLERMQNLNDAFKVVNKAKIRNKNILVVDDVFTTGSTINECAKALKLAGAKRVYGLTLASADFFRSVKSKEK